MGSTPTFQRLKAVIERRDNRAGRVFDSCIQILIVMVLIAFTIETLPALPETLQGFLSAFEVFSIAIFTAEYLLRILVADNRPRFMFSFFGLVDLVAIVPFYVTLGLDLRVARVFRLLRLLKLFRYVKAIDHFRRAFFIVKDQLVLFVSVAAIVLYLSAVGVYFFEHEVQPEAFKSIFHALWWAVVTLTTVGYGDVYPITTGGRIFTFFVLIVGLGLIAIPTGLVASALSSTRAKEDDDE